jgi:hypothetical protein
LRALALVALFLAGIHQGWTFRPWDRAVIADDQLYFYVAERAASGVAPHASLVDHKHQLSGLVSGAAMAVGRLFGADDVQAARVPSIVFAAAVVPLLTMLAAALTGSFAAGLVAGACALTFRMFFIEAATGFRPQLFMTFFAVAALVVHSRGRLAAAGGLAACAFLCWQPAAVVGAALVVAALFGPRPLASAARTALGGLAVVLAYEAYFAWKGALGEQIYQSYLMGRGLKVPALAHTWNFLLRGDPGVIDLRPDGIFTVLLLAGLACLWVWALIRPRRAWAAWRRNASARAVFLAAHGAIVFTALDHQAFPDRFFVLPYSAIAAAVAAALVPPRIAGLPLRVLICAGLVAWMVPAARFVSPTGRAIGALEAQRAIARRVVMLADAHGGDLWVIGRMDLLAFERRENWSPFGMLLDPHVMEYAMRKSGTPGRFRPLRDGKMPSTIVTARASVRRYMPWVIAEYEPIESKDREMPTVLVRKRNVPPRGR